MKRMLLFFIAVAALAAVGWTDSEAWKYDTSRRNSIPPVALPVAQGQDLDSVAQARTANEALFVGFLVLDSFVRESWASVGTNLNTTKASLLILVY